MFQNNPLLSQLKQQIRDNKPKVEGTVKSTDKAYGFLECDKKSYFLPPPAMKKVMHGDKICALIETVDGKEQAEPESLLEPFLTRFIARVHFNKDNKLQLFVDHPNIKQPISASVSKQCEQKLSDGDWVVATLKNHPLRDQRFFSAKVEQLICRADDQFAPWWVTLARHQQPREPVIGLDDYPFDQSVERQDLTHLHFVTIDSVSTQDMDDALYIEPIYTVEQQQRGWQLWVAIADPTAYIPEDSQIERDARQRCFTNYLPGFNIPMLPRELSDQLCSLMPQQKRPAVVCQLIVNLEGALVNEPSFQLAWIESKAKLAYDDVSDFIEQITGRWQPVDEDTRQQIKALHQFTLARIDWRTKHALIFKDRPDYSFILAENGEVKEIRAEYRRIANRIVEECMIVANICAAQFLAKNAGCGIFNTHSGFDKKFLANAQQFLLDNLADQSNTAQLAERYALDKLTTLAGYCQMQRDLEGEQQHYLELRLRRYLSFAEFKTELAPHFGLGLEGYATWTSPIRKYSDMVNHRLIKAVLHQQPCQPPEASILARLQEARKQNRLVERDIADWLYAIYLAPKVEQNLEYQAEIVDISRGGLRVVLNDNGATVFIPLPTLHSNKEEIAVNSDQLALYIKGERKYQLGQTVKLKLTTVKLETRSIVGELIEG
ncbi:exoribonuclease II [Mergibacter septicus]|uniref:Exoribonuclease 2 n=1 Tax=Mergibacter septicus TaxID=221402 RepID=A0A8D4J2G7_9PAST|nr:exoribonuclease II [Mergibacter septicus]AWX15630.1 exoribonuclease II [Mergibacter septicus]QDJ14884.1 exoribonuclease II [Mergibacter septicus]WMR96704.1 exoribonuclease II [Mergibacter septicus]